jgi:hypothetical protein
MAARRQRSHIPTSSTSPENRDDGPYRRVGVSSQRLAVFVAIFDVPVSWTRERQSIVRPRPGVAVPPWSESSPSTALEPTCRLTDISFQCYILTA